MCIQHFFLIQSNTKLVKSRTLQNVILKDPHSCYIYLFLTALFVTNVNSVRAVDAATFKRQMHRKQCGLNVHFSHTMTKC